jgi:hypothetical protein
MIHGAHFLLYSKDAEADRTFFRDVLRFRSVDAGEGWLIFALPPSELAVHPADVNSAQHHAGHVLMGTTLYLMCDDLRLLIKSLKAQKVKCAKIGKAPWGSYTGILLPSGGEIGLYQPTHPTAHRRKAK